MGFLDGVVEFLDGVDESDLTPVFIPLGELELRP